MLKNIIWDFDGTLFDTYPFMTILFQKALREFSHEASVEEILSLMKQTLGRAVEYYRGLGVDDRFYALFKVAQDDCDPDSQQPFPHALEVCSRVIGLGGKNLIITHRSRKTAFKLLRHHKASSLFCEVITRESGFKRKPDPEAFNRAIESHRLRRTETLAVGDRDLDVLAATRAGIKSCFFSQAGSRPTVEVDFTVESLAELLQIIG